MTKLHIVARGNAVDKDVVALVNTMLDEIFPGTRRFFTVTEIRQVPGSPQQRQSIHVTGSMERNGMKAVVQPGDNGTAVLVVIGEDNKTEQEKIWHPIVHRLKGAKGWWYPKPAPVRPVDEAPLSSSLPIRSKAEQVWQQFLAEIPLYLGFAYFAFREAHSNMGKSFKASKDDTRQILRYLTETSYLQMHDGEWRLTTAGALKAKAFKSAPQNMKRLAEVKVLVEDARRALEILENELAYHQ